VHLDALSIFIGLVIGAAAGAIAAQYLLRTLAAKDVAEARARYTHELAVGQTRLEERDRHVMILQEQLDTERAERGRVVEELATLREQQAAAAASAEQERRAAGEKLALLQEAERQLREAFESLSSDALRRNNQSFLELARETLGAFQQQATGDLEKRQQAIDELVRPIRESLAKFDEKIGDVEKARINAYASLDKHLGIIEESQQLLRNETANLVKALRTPHVRGQWGEMQLRRVVEIAGMLEYCDFDKQPTLRGEDGVLRPDLVVRLPGGKRAIIDAKTPLDAYVSANQTDDEPSRDELMRTHARQVRNHVAKLSDKRYWSQLDGTPDYVVMFLAGEALYSSALQYDPELLEFAWRKNVLIASPSTLIAFLRAAAHGWSQERIAENAERISALGRELYERLQTMAAHFEKVGKRLTGAVEAYNDAVGSLEGRVMVSARRFTELGVGAQERLPELAVVDRSVRRLQPGTVPLEADDDGGDEREPDRPPRYLAADA